MTELTLYSLRQFCSAAKLPEQLVVEIVELGIIRPVTPKSQPLNPEQWQFDTNMLGEARRAYRLHKQLEVDWPGVALAMQLLSQVEELRRENERLQLRLQRFLEH